MGQIYLGSEEFVAQHQPNHVIGDVPHRQAQTTRPSLQVLFHGKQSEAKAIHLAYCRLWVSVGGDRRASGGPLCDGQPPPEAGRTGERVIARHDSAASGTIGRKER